MRIRSLPWNYPCIPLPALWEQSLLAIEVGQLASALNVPPPREQALLPQI